MADQQKYTEILDTCVDYVRSNGLKDLSLRSLAFGVNKSARMLLHYFGNAESLFSTIMFEFVKREKSRADEIFESAYASRQPLKAFLEIYTSSLTKTGTTSIVNSIFEMYGAAVIGNKAVNVLLKDLLDYWVAGVKRLPEIKSETQAVATLAFANGLVLDLLASKDSKRIESTIKTYTALLSEKKHPRVLKPLINRRGNLQ